MVPELEKDLTVEPRRREAEEATEGQQLVLSLSTTLELIYGHVASVHFQQRI